MVGRRRATWGAPLAALAMALPGCGTMIAQGLHGEGMLRMPFGGVCFDLLACFLIFPIPLVALDLPLSLCADVVVVVDDLTEDMRHPGRHRDWDAYPTPGAPRARELFDGFVPVAEVTTAVVIASACEAPLRLKAASPPRRPRSSEAAALGGRGEALLGVGEEFEFQHSVVWPRDPLAREPSRWRAAPTSGRTAALALDEPANRGLVIDELGGAWLAERSASWAWTCRAPLQGAPHGEVVTAISPRGTRAAAGGDEGGVTLWDLGRPDLPGRPLGEGRVTALAFEGEEALVVGTATGLLLRLAPGAAAAPLASEPGMILAIACRGELLGWGGVVGGVTVRRGAAAPATFRLSPEGTAVVGLAFTRDGAGVWVAADDGTARRLELASGRELDRIDLRGLDDAPLRVLEGPTGGQVVLLTERGALLGFGRD